jgi:hypothetical protein
MTVREIDPADLSLGETFGHGNGVDPKLELAALAGGGITDFSNRSVTEAEPANNRRQRMKKERRFCPSEAQPNQPRIDPETFSCAGSDVKL